MPTKSGLVHEDGYLHVAFSGARRNVSLTVEAKAVVGQGKRKIGSP